MAVFFIPYSKKAFTIAFIILFFRYNSKGKKEVKIRDDLCANNSIFNICGMYGSSSHLYKNEGCKKAFIGEKNHFASDLHEYWSLDVLVS